MVQTNGSVFSIATEFTAPKSAVVKYINLRTNNNNNNIGTAVWKFLILLVWLLKLLTYVNRVFFFQITLHIVNRARVSILHLTLVFLRYSFLRYSSNIINKLQQNVTTRFHKVKILHWSPFYQQTPMLLQIKLQLSLLTLRTWFAQSNLNS